MQSGRRKSEIRAQDGELNEQQTERTETTEQGEREEEVRREMQEQGTSVLNTPRPSE